MLVIHNVYKYLYLGGRWRIFAMFVFYTCVAIILVFRTISLGYTIAYYKDKDTYLDCLHDAAIINQLDCVACMTWAVLGLF